MNNLIDLKKIRQKTYYETYYLDGLTELFVAIMLLFSPIIFFVPFFVVFIPIIMGISVPLTEQIRNKITYPRIGKIEIKEDLGKKSVRRNLTELGLLFSGGVIITLIVLMIFGGDPSNLYDWVKWIPMIFGIIMFGPSIFLVENTGYQRYYLFGILATLLGIMFSLMLFDNIYVRIGLYFQFMGLNIGILGFVRLLFFVRKYPVLKEEE